MESPNTSNLFDLQVDQHSSAFLKEAARWGKFLSIVGFIFCGIILLVALFAGSYLAGTLGRATGEHGMVGGAFISAIYIGVALLYFFPCLYLYNFSSKMQVALRSNDQQMLNASLKNLKSCFKFLGILTIITISVYVLAIFVGIFSAATR
jgi:hypothetical protein